METCKLSSRCLWQAVDYMVRHGTRFLRNSVPVRIELSDVDSSVKEGKQVKVSSMSDMGSVLLVTL